MFSFPLNSYCIFHLFPPAVFDSFISKKSKILVVVCCLIRRTYIMSRYQHEEIPTAYPAPPPSYPAGEEVKGSYSGPYVAAPPPVGYPVRDGPQYPHQTFTPQTHSKGDGFWKGCCAALCCCWVLDCVF